MPSLISSYYFYCFNGFAGSQLKSVTMAMCQIGMCLNLGYICCYSSLSSNHVGCPIMTLNFTIRSLSIGRRASSILLNICYFKFDIFKKCTIKGFLKKKDTLQEKFGEANSDIVAKVYIFQSIH